MKTNIFGVYQMIRDERKLVFRVSDLRSNINRAVQSQNMARTLKFGIYIEEDL